MWRVWILMIKELRLCHNPDFIIQLYLLSIMHPWPFSKSKFNLKSDRVNLVAPASPIECLLHLPNVWAIQSGTEKVDPARTFKCTTAVRGVLGNVLQLTGLKFVQLRHSLGPTLPAVTPGFNKCINIHRITKKWWDFIIKRRLYWIHIVFFLKFLWFLSAVNLFLSLS